MTNAQNYLELNYPLSQRKSIQFLNLSNQNLSGDLDLTSFPNLKEINITGNPQLGEVIDNKGWRKIIIRTQAQFWLNWKYPYPQAVKEIKNKWLEKIEISDQENLTRLQISSCPQLSALFYSGSKEKNIQFNQLVISNCPNLKRLEIFHSQLTSFDGENTPSLETLTLSDSPLINNLNVQNNPK